ncbi:hypothetical protein M2352_002403 [Azospirillum fermentarium]|uniref:hypothetical protein n=1 Tax=Azospirillum fermentarium TaxID=1233114 RepID=UPI0022271FE0|nr:hypothetical protein [Azospirillum fermentarium]MCW2246812.1 hypothetical protein [Azospirillum fermentarium]
MYYSTQVTGPGSSASTVATPVTKKTTDAKAADAKAAATTSAATPASSSPAYTISQSMESLLDAMSGKAPAKTQDDSGTATDSSGGGSSSAPSSSSANAGLKRATDAQRYMQAAADQGKQVASLLNKAVSSFKSDLGSMLSGLGMSDDKVKDAMGSFDDAMNSKMANMDFSNMAVDMQTARSQWTIESRGIELKIKDGDREVSISFAKSTLDFRKDEQSASAVFGANGDMTKAMFGQSTTTATAKATGIIVRGAENFSSDEMKNILGKLTDMASKGGGMKGLATLSPSTDSKGVMHLNVDLSVPVDGLSSGSSAAAASTAADSSASSSTPAASSVNISA